MEWIEKHWDSEQQKNPIRFFLIYINSYFISFNSTDLTGAQKPRLRFLYTGLNNQVNDFIATVHPGIWYKYNN